MSASAARNTSKTAVQASPTLAVTPVIALTRALMRCRSVTPADNGALNALRQRLEALGFVVRIARFAENGSAPVDNLFATIGEGRPHLLFAGHTDVVPPGDEAAWSYPPFDAVIADGRLYGRGAVDMKSGVAAFVEACAVFLADRGAAEPSFGRISLLITGDEEGPAVNGTVKMLQTLAMQGERFDAALVGEPTSSERLGDTIKVGRRGSLSGEVCVTGMQGHVAYPERARNPLPWLARIAAQIAASKFDTGSDCFQPSNLELVSIDTGNSAFNVIPNAGIIRFNVRFNDTWTPTRLKAHLRAAFAASFADAQAEGLSCAMTFQPDSGEAFLTQDAALIDHIANAIQAETGLNPTLSTGGGSSDARFVKSYCPVVEFGAVGATMHKVDECIPLAELERLTAVYARFLSLYFNAA